MLLHLNVPGFQAAIHQVHEPGLRRHPVAVAVDASEQAPLLAVSGEARAAGVHGRMRCFEARRRCPELIVRLPDAERARVVQAAITAAALRYTPLVASTPGQLDVDLAGSEDLWRTGLVPGEVLNGALSQAVVIARTLRQALSDDLGLSCSIGGGSRPFTARIAERLARGRASTPCRVVVLADDQETSITDPLPVHWLPATTTLLDHLVFRNITTIGAARRLGEDGLATVGGEAGRALHAHLHGTAALLPASLDAEASLSAASGTGAGGAGPRQVLQLLAGLAQQLGASLRRRHLAATRLSLTVRWGVGATQHVALVPSYQIRDDRDLVHLGERLLVKAGDRGIPWTWLRLTASGLCADEEQAGIFSLDCPLFERPAIASGTEANPVAAAAFVVGP
jgi:DNA polymerase-4